MTQKDVASHFNAKVYTFFNKYFHFQLISSGLKIPLSNVKQ
jgi:hypothetical protein